MGRAWPRRESAPDIDESPVAKEVLGQPHLVVPRLRVIQPTPSEALDPQNRGGDPLPRIDATPPIRLRFSFLSVSLLRNYATIS